MSLTIARAEGIIRAGRATAEKLGVKVSIAVVDDRGDLVAFARMDGARFMTVAISQGKALASALFGQPSGVLAERAGSPVFQSVIQMNQGRVVFGQGAMPITEDGHGIGAVGVSGATSQQDEDVAKAGLAAS
ncbi:MAG: heme-binding protein [Chloroflexota bacterium]